MKRRVILGLLLLALPTLLIGEIASPQQTPSLLSLQLTPALDVPPSASSAVFGAAGEYGSERTIVSLSCPWSMSPGDSATTTLQPPGGVTLSASVTSLSLGGGLRFDLLPWLSATIGAGVLHGRQRLDPGRS
jgi:hypothetical protein